MLLVGEPVVVYILILCVRNRFDQFSISKTGHGAHIGNGAGGTPPFTWHPPHPGMRAFEVESPKKPLEFSGIRTAE